MSTTPKRAALIAMVQPDTMTRQQAIAECRNLERELMELEDGIANIAAALWPEGENHEGPEPDEGWTVAEIIAGIQSLHELTDRLTRERGRASKAGYGSWTLRE